MSERLTEERLRSLESLYAPISHEEVLSLVSEVRASRAAPGEREERVATGDVLGEIARLRAAIKGFGDFGEGLAQPFGGRSKHVITAGKILIDMAAKALKETAPAPAAADTGVEARDGALLVDSKAVTAVADQMFAEYARKKGEGDHGE